MPTLPATSVDFFMAGLESFMVRSGQGQHWGVTAVWLTAAPDAALLKRAWEQVHERHLMLGARLRRQWRGWKMVWETDGPVVAPPVSWQALTGDPEQEERRLILKRLQGEAGGEALKAPLWLEVFAMPEGGRHLVLLTWRHGLMDGMGVNFLLEKLAMGSCETGPPVLPEPKVEGPGQLYAKARPLVHRLQDMTDAGSLSAWIKSSPAPRAPDYRLVQLSVEQTEVAAAKLRDLCGEFFQMPFYAAIAARALRRLHEMRGWVSPEIHLHLPAQIRGRSRELIFGNHMGTLPMFIVAAALDSLPGAVAHVQECYKEALKHQRPQASEAVMGLACRMPVSWFIPAVRLTNRGQICSVFHSHTGTFLGGRPDFAGAAVENVCTIPSVCAPPGLGLFFSDFGGKITVTLAWRGGGVSKEEIDTLATQMEADLVG